MSMNVDIWLSMNVCVSECVSVSEVTVNDWMSTRAQVSVRVTECVCERVEDGEGRGI